MDSTAAGGSFVRGRKSSETASISESPMMHAIDMIFQRVYPSERQNAEWVVRCLKGPFGRLRLPLNGDSAV